MKMPLLTTIAAGLASAQPNNGNPIAAAAPTAGAAGAPVIGQPAPNMGGPWQGWVAPPRAPDARSKALSRARDRQSRWKQYWKTYHDGVAAATAATVQPSRKQRVVPLYGPYIDASRQRAQAAREKAFKAAHERAAGAPQKNWQAQVDYARKEAENSKQHAAQERAKPWKHWRPSWRRQLQIRQQDSNEPVLETSVQQVVVTQGPDTSPAADSGMGNESSYSGTEGLALDTAVQPTVPLPTVGAPDAASPPPGAADSHDAPASAAVSLAQQASFAAASSPQDTVGSGASGSPSLFGTDFTALPPTDDGVGASASVGVSLGTVPPPVVGTGSMALPPAQEPTTDSMALPSPSAPSSSGAPTHPVPAAPQVPPQFVQEVKQAAGDAYTMYQKAATQAVAQIQSLYQDAANQAMLQYQLAAQQAGRSGTKLIKTPKIQVPAVKVTVPGLDKFPALTSAAALNSAHAAPVTALETSGTAAPTSAAPSLAGTDSMTGRPTTLETLASMASTKSPSKTATKPNAPAGGSQTTTATDKPNAPSAVGGKESVVTEVKQNTAPPVAETKAPVTKTAIAQSVATAIATDAQTVTGIKSAPEVTEVASVRPVPVTKTAVA